MTGFLRVTNFEKYQHYKDRRPVWIKFYVELLDDYELNRQKPQTRLLALMLLLVAATHDNRIPHDPEWLAGKVNMRPSAVGDGLDSLVSIGFLALASGKHSASKVLAKRYQPASPEKRREEKRQKEPKAFGDTQIEETISRSLRSVS